MPCKIVGGTKVPRNERARERKFPGTFFPRERKFPRTKRPGKESSRELSFTGNEKSRERKFPIGTIRSWERKVLGTKSPGTQSKADDVDFRSSLRPVHFQLVPRPDVGFMIPLSLSRRQTTD